MFWRGGTMTSWTDMPGKRPPYADRCRGTYHVFVRGYHTQAQIGVYAEERGRAQDIRISVDASVQEAAPGTEDLADVLCYHQLVQGIEAILSAGHIPLVETLADRIAQYCLSHALCISARVRVEKLSAIPGADAVGVEIERHDQDYDAGRSGQTVAGAREGFTQANRQKFGWYFL